MFSGNLPTTTNMRMNTTSFSIVFGLSFFFNLKQVEEIFEIALQFWETFCCTHLLKYSFILLEKKSESA